MKITIAQKEQIIALFNTPSSQLSTEVMMQQLETEMGIIVPKDLWSQFFDAGFGLNLRNRPRKNVKVEKEVKPKREVQKLFTFEFESKSGESLELTLARGKKSAEAEIKGEEAQESPNKTYGPESTTEINTLSTTSVVDVNVEESKAEILSPVQEVQQFGVELDSSFENLIENGNQ